MTTYTHDWAIAKYKELSTIVSKPGHLLVFSLLLVLLIVHNTILCQTAPRVAIS
jgi:hypothetical protein